mgnify:CR=1 FL=1
MGFPVVPDDECSSTTSSSGTANRPYGKVSRSTDLSVNGSMRTSSSVLMSEGVTPESSMRARYQGTRSYDPANLRDELLQLDGADALARGAFDSRIVDGQA